MGFTYIKIARALVTSEMVRASVESSLSTLRQSSDGFVWLKWETGSGRPVVLAGLGQEMSRIEAKTETLRSEWGGR